MLSILCPHCGAKLTVQRQSQGQAVTCLGCAQKFAVPVVDAIERNTEVNTEQPVIVAAKSPVVRRRRRSVGNRMISLLLHLSITGTTVYAGYYLLRQHRADSRQPPTSVASRSAPAPPVINKLDEPASVALTPPSVETIDSLVTQPDEAAAEPTPVVSPFESAPQTVTLPSTESQAPIPLVVGAAGASFNFHSNSPELACEAGNLLWKNLDSTVSNKIAVIKPDGDDLEFRWLSSVPAAAETAVRNAIVRLQLGEYQHVLCLREPDAVTGIQIDLAKSPQRIFSKFAHLPQPTDICLELLNLDKLPPATVDGVDLTQLRYQEQSTLRYLEAPGTVTQVRLSKRGKVAVVELENRYSLPSGDEHPMTIVRGNSKLKELTAIYETMQAAEKAIGSLRDQLKRLQREAKAVPRSRATATAKAIQLQRLRQSISATQQKIGYAERLISQKQAIVADYQAIQQVAKLAQQLHETRLAYRFFTVVDGHQVDLLIAN
ncbi:MAG: hypothetical protein AAGD11_16480 [Planctomycetota bacterium]